MWMRIEGRRHAALRANGLLKATLFFREREARELGEGRFSDRGLDRAIDLTRPIAPLCRSNIRALWKSPSADSFNSRLCTASGSTFLEDSGGYVVPFENNFGTSLAQTPKEVTESLEGFNWWPYWGPPDWIPLSGR